MNGANGCSNHGCIVDPPSGMGTNGGCKCLAELPMEKRRRVQIELASLRRRLAYATKFIEEVKHDCYSKKIGSMAEQVLVKLKKGEC